MARTIPSGSHFLTLVPGVKTKELGGRRKSTTSEYYTIDDLIFTAVGEGGGCGSLGELIVMTNTDGAFSHLPDIYNETPGVTNIPAGTVIEDLLREILNPYNTTDLTFNHLTVEYDDSGTTVLESASTTDLEVGQKVVISSISYTVEDHTKVVDDSIVLKENGSMVANDISDTSSSYPYSRTISQDNPHSWAYQLFAEEDGGSVTVDISSSTKKFVWYNRVKTGASTAEDLGSAGQNATAQDIYDEIDLFSELQSASDIEFNGNDDTNHPDKYTWIAYPLDWNLGDILSGATSVKVDFKNMGIRTLTNTYGAVNLYYVFWKSRSKGAFDGDDFIKVTFT